MTNATKGLAKALARTASGDVVALAEMSADDLLAGMSDETRTQLAATLGAAPAPAAPLASMPSDDEPDDMCSECKTAKKDGKCKCAPADAGANAATTPVAASAHDRVKAVAASDEAKANPGAALALLADDEFAGLSANGIIGLVGKMSTAPAASSVDPEEAARAEMRAAISAGATNSTIDATAGGGQNAATDPAKLWGNVHQRMGITGSN